MRNYKVVLASSSARRVHMLSEMDLLDQNVNPRFTEKRLPGELPVDYVLRNSRGKACWVFDNEAQSQPSVVVAADTIVCLDEAVLEKPKDPEDAVSMLSRLSGREHVVVSGFTLLACSFGKILAEKSIHVKTSVTLKELSREEIVKYVQTGEPMDKAGSYAIQGKGAYMVKKISGSFTNVVGLPLAEFQDAFEALVQDAF